MAKKYIATLHTSVPPPAVTVDMYNSQAPSSTSNSHLYNTPAEVYDYARNSNPRGFSKGSPVQGNSAAYHLHSDTGVSSTSNSAAVMRPNATPFFTSNSHGPFNFHPQQQLPLWSSPSNSTGLDTGYSYKSALAQDANSLHIPSLLPPPPCPTAIQIAPSRFDDSDPSCLPPSGVDVSQMEPNFTASAQSPPSEDELPSLGRSKLREKKHGCWMCHKSFDRPSTLRKHLLVHTGEKAFVCETCGRRFGVASNLNRHTKRCVLRPVNNAQSPSPNAENQPAIGTTSASPLLQHGSPSGSDPATTNPIGNDTGSRSPHHYGKRGGSPSHSQPTDAPDHSRPKPAVKRRRRAPSPSHWIPHSLLAFNLSPAERERSTPVPLLPVTPIDYVEERNSYDGDVGTAPYAGDWKGRLPGPGLAHAVGLVCRDVRKLGGFLTGRVEFY